MNWQLAAHRLGISVALAGAALALSQPAQAQSKKIERTLAGVRLNSASRLILAKFGNPNEIYLGDIGARLPGQGQGGAAAGDTGAMGGPGMGGAMMGSGGMGGAPMGMGGRGPGGAPMGMGGSPMMGGSGAMMGGGPRMGGSPMMGSSGMGGAPMGMGGRGPGGAPMGMGGSPMMGSSGMGGAPMGMGGRGGMNSGDGGDMPMMGGGRGPGGAPMGMGGRGSSAMMGGGGMGGGGMAGGVSGFGNTMSTAARQQEVTWVYNRMVKDAKGQNTAVSYEFLINPSGAVSQIRTLGYQSPLRPVAGTPGIITERGIRLNSSYADVLRVYGQPEGYEKVGNVLVLSYPKRHIQFQLINQKEQADPVKAAYRVIAITIATIEG